MTRYAIRAYPELCTGCLRCQLACSFSHTGAFNPEAAFLRVVHDGVNCTIRLARGCDGCGECADDCFYGALEKAAMEDTP
ncbi:MAG: hypothetical protein ACLFOY_07745 [Desulfatibacillaceae bacterium]